MGGTDADSLKMLVLKISKNDKMDKKKLNGDGYDNNMVGGGGGVRSGDEMD